MSGGWPRVRIEDAAERVGMGPFGSSIKVSTFVPDGVPVISGQHLRGSRLDDLPGYNFITHEHAQRLKNALVGPGDVVLTHAGNIGQVAYVPDTAQYDQYVISQRQFFVRCSPDRLLPEYLTYYLHSPEGHHQLMANAVQTGVPSIAQPVTYVRSIEIPLPPVDVQRRIVDSLGMLDDKLQSNARTARLLEDHVRTRFQREFSVERAITGTSIYDLVDVNPRRQLQKGHDATYVSMSDLPTDSAIISSWGRREFSSGQRFQNGDVLMARITPCLENGKTAVVDMLAEGEIGWGSTEFVVMAPRGNVSTPWLYCLARSNSVRDFAIRSMTGTSGRQRFSADAFKDYRLGEPEAEALAAFNSYAVPAFAYLAQLRNENRTLAALRNTLLPAFINGKVAASASDALAEVPA